MTDFVSIDFETANGKPSSVCSVGAVIVNNGEVVDSFYSLIRPRPNYYAVFCRQVHGLGYEDTDCAEEFPEVWSDLIAAVHRYYPYIEDGEVPFVAHNSRFDEGCLKAVFAAYDMAYPDYEFRDTLYASRKYFGRNLVNHQLQTVAAACGYDLRQHHHALADAEACAIIATQIM